MSGEKPMPRESASQVRRRQRRKRYAGLAECGVGRSRRAPCTIYQLTPAGAEAIKGEAK